MEHKLLIHPITKTFSWERKIGFKKPIQNKEFKCGIKIKNIGKSPIEDIIIKDVSIFSTSGKGIAIVFSKTKKIPLINPDETKKIWFEKTKASFSGDVWLRIKIEQKKGDIINTYQWDETNNYAEEYGLDPEDKNHCNWKSFFTIQDEFILQQKITNIILIILVISGFLV